MKFRIYLPRHDYCTLLSKGDPEEIINSICSAVAQGYVSLVNLPHLGNRQTDVLLTVDIKDTAFLSLKDEIVRSGRQLSLRRIIHYVLDAELIDDVLSCRPQDKDVFPELVDQFLSLAALIVHAKPELHDAFNNMTLILKDSLEVHYAGKQALHSATDDTGV